MWNIERVVLTIRLTPTAEERFAAGQAGRRSCVAAALQAQRRALSNPAFETRNGTMKFSAQRTQVAAVA